MYRIATSLAICTICCVAERPASAISIDTRLVGNAGNAADSVVMNDGTTGYGAVDYAYRIGTFEVTNAQYVEYLNAKAASDPLGLYDTKMSTVRPGIDRSGSSGSYSYSVVSGRELRPVNHITWYDALRFANWLHNGQENGDTETGAYTLLGGTPIPTNAMTITRNPGATWFLPSEDEWYKAAFHKNDGVTGNYFAYPTGSDELPIAEAPPGGNNSANYDAVVYEPNIVTTFTDVGAYLDAASPYGSFDQGGNIYEWNESLSGNIYRVLRGASTGTTATESIRSSHRLSSDPALEGGDVGFRVATIVPEPNSGLLAALAVAGAGLVSRRCHRRAKQVRRRSA